MVHRDEVEDAEVAWVEIRTERAAPGHQEIDIIEVRGLTAYSTRMLALAHVIRTMAMKVKKDTREMTDLSRQLSRFFFYRKKK